MLDPDISNSGRQNNLISKTAAILRRNTQLKRAARKILSLAAFLDNPKSNLYWEPNHILLPNIKSAHCAVTVHDLSCLLHREWHPRERLNFFDRYFENGLKRADRIIAVSDTVRKEIMEHYKVPDERLTFIHNGLDSTLFRPLSSDDLDRFREDYKLPQRFFLSVASLEPRKNLQGLLTAWSKLSGKYGRECKLILIANAGWENSDIMKQIREGERRGDVELRNSVPTRDLPYYYNLADFAVYLSFYEGFGLPPLEAMACGTPALISDIPIHREVSGSPAEYVRPDNIDEITGKLEQMLSGESAGIRAERSELFSGIRAKYSWEKCASEYERAFAPFIS